MLGFDGMAMANETDMIRSTVMAAALKRANELRQEELDYMATRIRHELVEAWNKGNK